MRARPPRAGVSTSCFPAGLRRLATAISQAVELGASGLVTHSLHSPIFPLRTHAGRKLLHNISIRPLGNRPNLGCLLQIVDVTVAAGRERILRERQNARYDAVVGGAPDAILTLDAEGVIQLVNPAAAREFGYASDELIGQSMAFLLKKPDEWNKAFKAILDGERLSRPIELTARRKNGAPSYLEASASRWKSEGRTFVTAILRDVNERRMAVDALRLLNQTLETAGRPEHRRPQPHVDAVDRRHDGRRTRWNDQFDQPCLDALAGLAGSRN